MNHVSTVIRINPYHDINSNNAAVLQAEREDKMVTSSKESCSSNHMDNHTHQNGIPKDIQTEVCAKLVLVKNVQWSVF